MLLVWEVGRGRGVTVLSRDKTECRAGVGGGGECRKMGGKYLRRMTKKFEDTVSPFNADKQ